MTFLHLRLNIKKCPTPLENLRRFQSRVLRKCTNLPVVSYVEGVETLGEALHVVGADLLQKVDVVFRMKPAHVMLRCLVWFKNLSGELCSLTCQENNCITNTEQVLNTSYHHLLIQSIMQHKTVCKRQAVRFHWVSSTWNQSKRRIQ